jgi:hypothetical protein
MQEQEQADLVHGLALGEGEPSLLEKESVFLTKRPKRWRSVQFQRSTWLVCPLLLPTGWYWVSGNTFL